MIVRQYAPCSLGRSIICLGKQGEINALRVEFDVSAWMAMYPDATVKLMHFAPDRPQDNPVIPTLGVEGTLRVWIVGEEDTAGAGNGVIELLLIDERTGSTIKSATGYTTVLRSPSAGIEAQEPEPGYVRYDVDQSALLTDTQKAFARTNIDAIKDEKDPTVPDWAKQPSKPTYTASEVGALPSSYTPPVTSVNGKTGEVALNAQDVGARPDTWTPSASDVGADASGTAAAQVGAHNISGEAHADLRALIEGLTSRLNALADSDDNTLDQLSEIVAYIKSNRTLIDAVTTGKVSVSDIVDNLTTNASGKVLSAAQGVALKAMIDGIVIPTALPNPKPITINGQHYDGSDAVTVTTAEIDDTLTQSGKAADAKAVGDQLSALNEATAEEVGQLKSDLTQLNDCFYYDTETVKPNNILPKNSVTIEKFGVVVKYENGTVTITGTYTQTFNFSYQIGEIIPDKQMNLFPQVWDVSGNINGLSVLSVKDYGNAKDDGTYNGISANSVAGEVTPITIRIYPGFVGSVTFKPTISINSQLVSYEEYFEPYDVKTNYCLKESKIPKLEYADNVLYGKKWAVCGDSFTNGDWSGSTEQHTIKGGKYDGQNAVYGYLIGNRNNMEIQHMAFGGRTLATPSVISSHNCFTDLSSVLNYTEIDSDADYITMYFGINDSHNAPSASGSDGETLVGEIPLGTINDTTANTFYGAWNIALPYLVEHHPYAKIGIIVSNGCDNDNYRIATIDCAKKWGIPYIDLNGDERTPMMNRSTNPNISSQMKTLKNNAFRVSSTNAHPNAKAHEYESWFIENFLRSL